MNKSTDCSRRSLLAAAIASPALAMVPAEPVRYTKVHFRGEWFLVPTRIFQGYAAEKAEVQKLGSREWAFHPRPAKKRLFAAMRDAGLLDGAFDREHQ